MNALGQRAAGLFLFPYGRWSTPPIAFGSEQVASLVILNAVSGLSLMVFLGWVLAGTRREG